MGNILNIELFTVLGRDITVLDLMLTLLAIALLLYVYRWGVNFFGPKVKSNIQVSEENKKRFWKILRFNLLFLILIVVVSSLKLDHTFALAEDYSINTLTILRALFFWQLAHMLDWIINNLFIDYFYPKNQPEYQIRPATVSKARKTVQYVFYLLVVIYILRNFGLDYQFHEMTIGEDKNIQFTLSKFIEGALIILIARLFVWSIVHLVLINVYKNKEIEVGSQFAINQLIKYVIYTFAIISALSVIGINITLLLGGAAALLVGIGLGLQQTFNDFVSGIVILFERTVSVGDVLEFDGTVGEVVKIGLRSSILHTRQNVSMVVPNHYLVNEKVINWTHFDNNIRFAVDVGVAYGSDTALVKELLKKSVEGIDAVLAWPKPFVRFNNFGDSSLDFSLYFFSREYMTIEDVRSDIRLNIDALFRENNITIPFPQREITVKTKD